MRAARHLHVRSCDRTVDREELEDGNDRGECDRHRVCHPAQSAQCPWSVNDVFLSACNEEVQSDGQHVGYDHSNDLAGHDAVESGRIENVNDADEVRRNGDDDDAEDGNVPSGMDLGQELWETLVSCQGPEDTCRRTQAVDGADKCQGRAQHVDKDAGADTACRVDVDLVQGQQLSHYISHHNRESYPTWVAGLWKPMGDARTAPMSPMQ